jgi:hypothetical protein
MIGALWIVGLLLGCGQERQGGTAVGNPGRTYVRLAPPADPVQAGPYVGWVRADVVSLVVTAAPCDGDPVVASLADVSLLDGPEVAIPGGDLCRLDVVVEGLYAEGDGLLGWETLELVSASASLELGSRAIDGGTWIVELGEPGAPDEIADRSALFDDIGADGVLTPLERSQVPLAAGAERDAEVVGVLLAAGTGGTRLVIGVGEAMPVLSASTGPGGYDVAAGKDGAWIAAGVEGVSVSTDLGLSWTEQPPLPDVTGASASDGASFWLVGGGGTWWSVDPDGTEVLSTDPEVWNAIADTSYGPVRVGNGVIDVDGSLREFPGVEFRAVAEHDGQLVAVGDVGARWVSDDGLGWDDVSAPGGPDLAHVVHTGSSWVAVATFLQETVQGSPDGRTWSDVGVKGMADVAVVDGVLFGAVLDGLYRSDDDGATWVFASNYPGYGVELRALAVP